jgi:hypothetical protein
MTVIVILNLILAAVLAGIAATLVRSIVRSTERPVGHPTRPRPTRGPSRTVKAGCSGDGQRERPRLILVYSADAGRAADRR